MRPSWTPQADPESNDKDPDNRQKRRHRQDRGETIVAEAETGGRQPQRNAEGPWGSQGKILL